MDWNGLEDLVNCDLETYLQQVPNDPDRNDLEDCLEDLREKVDRMV